MGAAAIGEAATGAASDVASSDLSSDVKIILLCVILALAVLAIIIWAVRKGQTSVEDEEAMISCKSTLSTDGDVAATDSRRTELLPNEKRNTRHSITISITDHESQDTRALLAPEKTAIDHGLPSPLPTAPRPRAQNEQEMFRYC